MREKNIDNNRALWLSDTFDDQNGVSTALQAVHQEIKLRNLPVDLMVCSKTLQSDDHLIVIRPVREFALPLYRQQPLRVPNYFSIHRIFQKGKYNRVICSTEGPMGLAALYLKNRFSVEATFFLHTDWITFARDALAMEQTGLDRMERLILFFYRRFNNIVVLNTDQQQWLIRNPMGFEPSRVFLSAHWADAQFTELPAGHCTGYPFDVQQPVLLYAGRLSKEKGVFDLPEIFRMVRAVFPEVQLVVAGTGPAGEELQELIPEASFLGWVSHEAMPSLFHVADILILPSRFDTFSCAALEALGCGLPVAAYNVKGPKDIILDSVNGFLVETPQEMAGKTVEYLLDPALRIYMKKAAVQRANEYKPGPIMDRLLQDIGIKTETCLFE